LLFKNGARDCYFLPVNIGHILLHIEMAPHLWNCPSASSI